MTLNMHICEAKYFQEPFPLCYCLTDVSAKEKLQMIMNF